MMQKRGDHQHSLQEVSWVTRQKRFLRRTTSCFEVRQKLWSSVNNSFWDGEPKSSDMIINTKRLIYLDLISSSVWWRSWALSFASLTPSAQSNTAQHHSETLFCRRGRDTSQTREKTMDSCVKIFVQHVGQVCECFGVQFKLEPSARTGFLNWWSAFATGLEKKTGKIPKGMMSQ